MVNHSRNPTVEFFKRYYSHKMASFGTGMVFLFLAVSFCAPIVSWLIGVDHTDQNVFNRYLPLMTEAGVSPFATIKTPIFHLLGTDELGRDVLMRLIYGTQVSIGIGIAVGVLSALIGGFVGTIAGYYGGRVDALLMRVTDSMLSLPLIPVLIVLAAVDLKKIAMFSWFVSAQNESITKMILCLCLFSWMTIARLVRGSILSIKERDYVAAAKVMGAGDIRVMVKHILPNTVGPLLVAVSLIIGQAILIEAGLSYLGLGVQPPTPSWGNMLFNAQEIIYEAPMLAVFPGLLILLAVISFNFIGDGLQQAFNPKS